MEPDEEEPAVPLLQLLDDVPGVVEPAGPEE
jgi:hypothetical protein